MKIRHLRGISRPARSGDAWFYVSHAGDIGVWKFDPGAEPAKILSGSYDYPVVTPNGKWLVVVKEWNDGRETRRSLVRHNLQTGKEFQVDMSNDDYRPPVTYVAAHGKVLLGKIGFDGEPSVGAMNYLLDVETGMVEQAHGEFRPFIAGEFRSWVERFARELQPTGNPNEFWAAVYDEQTNVTRLGRYDSKTFAFTPLVELPELFLSSYDFWVDATAGKIWLTYGGHLLRIPLPAQSK
jgi:hypothetical protein